MTYVAMPVKTLPQCVQKNTVVAKIFKLSILCCVAAFTNFTGNELGE